MKRQQTSRSCNRCLSHSLRLTKQPRALLARTSLGLGELGAGSAKCVAPLMAPVIARPATLTTPPIEATPTLTADSAATLSA